MKATITSTSAIVEIEAIGFPGRTQARVWEGISENGVPFTAYIPVVQVHKDADNSQFERELQEHKQPSPETRRAIDARFVL
jgi:hypothetical protein